MYLKSGEDYWLIPLIDKKVICTDGSLIKSPNVKVRLLNYFELSKCISMQDTGMNELDINEEICEVCVLGMIGFDHKKIDFLKSDAFICDTIANKIVNESYLVLQDLPKAYSALVSTVSEVERLAAIVSHYLHIPYTQVSLMPVDEIVKKYSICALSFPGLAPIEYAEEEGPSKVG